MSSGLTKDVFAVQLSALMPFHEVNIHSAEEVALLYRRAERECGIFDTSSPMLPPSLSFHLLDIKLVRCQAVGGGKGSFLCPESQIVKAFMEFVLAALHVLMYLIYPLMLAVFLVVSLHACGATTLCSNFPNAKLVKCQP
jgi:hypothetical protein